MNDKLREYVHICYTSSNRITQEDDVALPSFLPYPRGNTAGHAVVRKWRRASGTKLETPLMERQSTAAATFQRLTVETELTQPRSQNYRGSPPVPCLCRALIATAPAIFYAL